MSGYSDSDDWEAQYDREEVVQAATAHTKDSTANKNRLNTYDTKAQRPTAGNLRVEASPHYPSNVSKKDAYGCTRNTLMDRARSERLNVQAETELIGNLLEGCELEDFDGSSQNPKGYSQFESEPRAGVSGSNWNTLTLKTLADVKRFGSQIVSVIEKGDSKSVFWLALLKQIMEVCVPKMEEKDVKTIIKKLTETMNDAAVTRRVVQQNKKKVNTNLASKGTNYLDELDIFYGDYKDSAESSEDGFM